MIVEARSCLKWRKCCSDTPLSDYNMHLVFWVTCTPSVSTEYQSPSCPGYYFMIGKNHDVVIKHLLLSIFSMKFLFVDGVYRIFITTSILMISIHFFNVFIYKFSRVLTLLAPGGGGAQCAPRFKNDGIALIWVRRVRWLISLNLSISMTVSLAPLRGPSYAWLNSDPPGKSMDR